MKDSNSWNGQNVPRAHNNAPWESFAILPVLECFLKYDADTIDDLLPSINSYGWDDSLTNALVCANNYHRITYLEPEFTRYGCLPSWFPNEDSRGRRLTDQGRVDRFLYLLDVAFGGLPDDHADVDPRRVAQAILELHDNLGTYVDIEVGDGLQWEVDTDPPKPQTANRGSDQ